MVGPARCEQRVGGALNGNGTGHSVVAVEVAVIKSLIKVSLKLAFLPLGVPLKIVRKLRARRKPASAWKPPVSSGAASAPDEDLGPSPFEVQVDPSALIQRMGQGEEMLFIDVRQADELAQTGMIEGAVHIPTQDLPHRLDELDKDAETVLYCAAGVRSLDAALFLREKGFANVWSLGGGLPHWEHDGGTVVTV